MASSTGIACQFSSDGKYFAQLLTEGKLKIWNTLSNTFEQEFTPDYRLTSTCTCLHFVNLETVNKPGSPRKKKRKNDSKPSAALGTTSGLLLIYSLSKAELDYTVDSNTSQSINCLSSGNNGFAYSGTDNSILVWDLFKRNIESKWIAGNEKINAILYLPSSDKLLTASKNIKLWNIQTKEVLKTYTGHSSQVTLLYFVNPKDTTDGYFISGSKGDRLLNCWNLDESVEGKNAIASFLMEDIVNNLSVYVDADGLTSLAAAVRSGVVHVYQHTLNGKCIKPLKPKTTLQVVSDSKDQTVTPMHIAAATYRDAQTLCISYGTLVVQTFEDVTISSYEKLQCLIRENIVNKTVSKENQVSKIKAPIVENDVHYLTSQAITVASKRRNDGKQEIPMEKRLENLMINDSDSSSKVPKANNMAQLLVQGLHSKDQNILKTVLFKKDEQLIKTTIKRIPFTAIVPLFEELAKFIQGKTLSRKIGLMWLKHLMLAHAGLLLANPDLSTIFGEILGNIEAVLALQTNRNKLMGRLELLVSQISVVSSSNESQDNAIIVFNDKASSDSDSDRMEFDINSNSENDWEAGSEDGDEPNENGKIKESDNDDDSDEHISS